MKRIVTMVAVLGIIVAACGGGDDETVATPAPAADDETSKDAEPTADDDATAEEPAAEDPSTDETADSEDAADDDVSDIGPIGSLDDIPERCRDLMADFLREIEPLVSPLDWQTASLSEFEAIGEDFEAMSDDFDTRGELAGCNDLDFVGDSEFYLMAEFARDVAPGTVGFLEFIAAIGSGSPGADGETAAGSEIETCDDGVEFMQDLVDNYDTVADVPASELLKFQQLSLVFISCTPEQIEFFDSPDVLAFMGE